MKVDSNPFDVRVVDGLSISPSPAGQTLLTDEGVWSFGPALQSSGNDILLNGARTGAGVRIFQEGLAFYHENAFGARYLRVGKTWVESP